MDHIGWPVGPAPAHLRATTYVAVMHQGRVNQTSRFVARAVRGVSVYLGCMYVYISAAPVSACCAPPLVFSTKEIHRVATRPAATPFSVYIGGVFGAQRLETRQRSNIRYHVSSSTRIERGKCCSESEQSVCVMEREQCVSQRHRKTPFLCHMNCRQALSPANPATWPRICCWRPRCSPTPTPPTRSPRRAASATCTAAPPSCRGRAASASAPLGRLRAALDCR